MLYNIKIWELAEQSLPWLKQYFSIAFLYGRGKSGLHRVKCQVTPGGRKLMESATENKPHLVIQV